VIKLQLKIDIGNQDELSKEIRELAKNYIKSELRQEISELIHTEIQNKLSQIDREDILETIRKEVYTKDYRYERNNMVDAVIEKMLIHSDSDDSLLSRIVDKRVKYYLDNNFTSNMKQEILKIIKEKL